MDGYPIYGPGINPATGEVWSQNDMDACGGQEINGKYAYYTTGNNQLNRSRVRTDGLIFKILKYNI